MMCMKTPILVLHKNQHGIWKFNIFFKLLNGWGVVSDTEMYIFRREHKET